MKETKIRCDISSEQPNKRAKHKGEVKSYNRIMVVFDHDQEDGKSKVKEYLEYHDLDLCQLHFLRMVKERKLIYAYGAMSFNKYYL